MWKTSYAKEWADVKQLWSLAHQATISGKLHTALKADHELDAMKLARGSRLASRQMGRPVLKIAAEQIEGVKILQDYRVSVETELAPSHLPVALGLTLGASGLEV